MTERKPAEPSAHDALERWRALGPRTTGERTFSDRDAVAELIASHLDAYAYEHLSKRDRAWWERVWNADEEVGAFSRLFGPEWIVDMMDGFLGWFLIRKVAASREDMAAYPVLCEDLVRWLVDEGLVAPARAADARAAQRARPRSCRCPKSSASSSTGTPRSSVTATSSRSGTGSISEPTSSGRSRVRSGSGARTARRSARCACPSEPRRSRGSAGP